MARAYFSDGGDSKTQHLPRCSELSAHCLQRRNSFYRAACNADAVLWWEFCLSVRLSVRLSVSLSVTRVNCDKTVPRSVQIFIPYETTFSLVFWKEEWLVGATPSTWNFGSTDPRWNEIAEFQPIIARSSSAVTPSEKSSINANRKSTTRFPISLRWSSYVAPKSPKGGLKTQNGRFA